jgi:CRP-like cAMP-binding protein
MPDESNGSDCQKRYHELLHPEAVRPLISKISVLAGLSDKQLDTLFQYLHKACYQAGEKIFEEGAPPSHIYVVKSGKVKLVINAEDTPLELVVFEEGRCFGETSVIGIQTHSATAVAIEPTELIVLSRSALLSLLDSDLELFTLLILNLAREACRRLHKTDEILLHYVMRS